MTNNKSDEPWIDRYAATWINERLQTLLQSVDDTNSPPAALEAADEAVALLEDWMSALVVTSRDYDFSWEDISSFLRITRQAAWSRWRDLAPDRTNDPDVIELLIGIGAERQLRRRTADDDVKRHIEAAAGPVDEREAIIRFLDRRASRRAAKPAG